MAGQGPANPFGSPQMAYEMMSQAMNMNAEAQKEAYAGAIQRLLASGQRDVAPQMPQPFPTGGILGALAGLGAGVGGILPSVMAANLQAANANQQQQGYLKLRQQQREEKVADLEAQAAGIDSDLAVKQARLALEAAGSEDERKWRQKNYELALNNARNKDKDTYKDWLAGPYSAGVNANLQKLLGGVNEDGSPITPEQFAAIREETELALELGRAPSDVTLSVMRMLAAKDKSLFDAYAEQYKDVSKDPQLKRTKAMGDRLFGEEQDQDQVDQISAALDLVDTFIGLSDKPEIQGAGSIFTGLDPRQVRMLESLPTPYDLGPVPTRGPFTGKQ